MRKDGIKAVMIGVGEPIKGGAGLASTEYDGRTIVYQNGKTELVESNGLILMETTQAVIKAKQILHGAVRN